MRSLAFKLTLAFLLVGITGAVLVAVLVGQRTRSEFDRFVLNREQGFMLTTLGNYYLANGSWEGVDKLFQDNQHGSPNEPKLTLTNIAGEVVFSNHHDRPGEIVPRPEADRSLPVRVGSETVGFIIFEGSLPRRFNRPPIVPAPETDFLRRVTWATAISAGIAVIIALVMGGVLARSFARPIRELTAATQIMAKGELGQQVQVRSDDEIGQLATSFNHMSVDLAQANQTRQQMTADIAHDLRTPLSILRGYTEGLKAGNLEGSSKIYAIMHEEVEHLQHLVEDLRTLSLADAGELRLNRRSVDPKALLERTGLAYIIPAEQKGLRLKIEAGDDLPPVSVDVERMTQVLNNLVSNALRHTQEGEIVLGAEVQEQHLNLVIRDTGTGIPAEDLPHIFHRFYRTDKSRRRDEGSFSGLGLAIAKAIIEAHQGQILVFSTPAEGTIFTVTLPLDS